MSELANEEKLTLTQAAKLAPGRPHASSLWRHCRKGCIAVMDYVQRITSDPTADARINAGMVMQSARAIADRGVAVLCVSALARGKGASGSTYQDAGLASFRESAELEYGADQAIVINQTSDGPRLDVCKNRYGMTGKYPSAFNGQSLRWKIGGRA
jgi:replicative DNA helicase